MEYEEAPVVEASSVVSFAIAYLFETKKFWTCKNTPYENGVCVCGKVCTLKKQEKLLSV